LPSDPASADRGADLHPDRRTRLVRRHLGRLAGFYTTQVGNLHQVVLIWEYESLADMEQKRARMLEDPEWSAYMDEVWAMNAIESQETRILKPIPLA